MEHNIDEYVKYSSKILFSETIDQAWTAYQEFLKKIGFDKIIFLSSHFSRGKNWGNPKDTLILSNHDNSYNHSLFNNKTYFLQTHPNFKKLLEKPGSEITWTKVNLEEIQNDVVKNIVHLNNKYKITTGIQFSLKQIKPGSACVIMLTGKSDIPQKKLNSIWAKRKGKIIILSKILQLSIRNLPYSSISLGPRHEKLTTRQIEILNLLADGNSIVQISKALNLSIPTIDKHLKLARLNLDVSTSAQAVSKALTEQMLFNSPIQESIINER